MRSITNLGLNKMGYIRKTKDIWEIQGYYGHEYGWECVTTEETRQEARQRLKEYRDNERYPFRLVKKRERIEAQQA